MVSAFFPVMPLVPNCTAQADGGPSATAQRVASSMCICGPFLKSKGLTNVEQERREERARGDDNPSAAAATADENSGRPLRATFAELSTRRPRDGSRPSHTSRPVGFRAVALHFNTQTCSVPQALIKKHIGFVY